MFERDYRDLAFVPRWAIAPTINNQSVAEHSFFVAVYAENILRFYSSLGYDIDDFKYETMLHAVLHDRTECYISDIPGPVKRSITNKGLFKAYEASIDTKIFSDSAYHKPDEALAIVKVADLMDEYGFWAMETMMGNKLLGVSDIIEQIEERVWMAIVKLPHLTMDEKFNLWTMFQDNLEEPKKVPVNNDDVADQREAV